MAAVAAVGLAAGLAQTVFSALQTKEVKEMCSMFQCESQLEKLQDTMSTIKAVLLDVESKRQGLTNEGQLWVEKLKDAVYDIDDLLDEFTTIAQQRKQDPKFSKKVGRFFSRNNKFFVSFSVSREIKLLREKLDCIANNHAKFGFTDVTKPVKRREETSSTISELEVIGREDDKEAVVDMLLPDQDHSSGQNVSYVSIVGIGGLGKTTLAQLVYNDESVIQAFSKRIWVCVSEDFGTKEILGQMLGKKDLTLEDLQTKTRKLLENKRYLLVLDDVWNESHDEWRKLKPFLVSDVGGSKIIVTTRSKKVASSIGKESVLYELKGLSEGNSWSLFKSIAFGERKDQVDNDLVDIGKDIVKKCANVPLSIRVIASLLYGEDKSHWRSLRDVDLAKMCHGEDSGIMPTLMFSYYNLTPELKSCFSFCSLFPKDYVIERELLISMWLAEGFLVATHHDGQSIEDVGERYFTILLNRCFFQDIQLDDRGEVRTCKMHDLMHDLALEVAGKECSIITEANNNQTGKKNRHLSMFKCLNSNMCSIDALRTYMGLDLHDCPSKGIEAIISKGRRLRVLELSGLQVETLPNSVGKLLHLRFLDLSENRELEILPDSITKLHNLQILKLTYCETLEELPEDTSKLVNLRTLDIDGCENLSHMPRGMDNLKNLQRLPEFVLGGVDSKQVQGSKLVDLQALTSLKGDLCIRIHEFSSNNMPVATGKAFLLKDAHILQIICGMRFGNGVDQSEAHETLVEELCPNDDVRRIKMVRYEGKRMPSWASMIVSVKVSNVKGLQHVTSLSQLCHLKVVELEDLHNVEYIESHEAWALVSRVPYNNSDSKVVFFPVLEKLVLKRMPELKGWWSGVRWEDIGGGNGWLVDATTGGGIHDTTIIRLPSFPRLRELCIHWCKSMMYFPPFPNVKLLHLVDVNEAMAFCTSSRNSASTSDASLLCLETLRANNERVMNSVSKEFVGGAVEIDLELRWVGGEMEERMGIVREGFERCGSSVRSISIYCGKGDWKLRRLGIEHLSNLQSLRIDSCEFVDEVGEENEEEVEGMPWKHLQSLSSLELLGFTKIVKLPKGLRYLGTSLQSLSIYRFYNMEEIGECIGFLTFLQSLDIHNCPKLKALPKSLQSLTSLRLVCINLCPELKSLPEAMCHLTSLTHLHIFSSCDELRERCRKPHGQDWSKVCHIPDIIIC